MTQEEFYKFIARQINKITKLFLSDEFVRDSLLDGTSLIALDFRGDGMGGIDCDFFIVNFKDKKKHDLILEFPKDLPKNDAFYSIIYYTTVFACRINRYFIIKRGNMTRGKEKNIEIAKKAAAARWKNHIKSSEPQRKRTTAAASDVLRTQRRRHRQSHFSDQ